MKDPRIHKIYMSGFSPPIEGEVLSRLDAAILRLWDGQEGIEALVDLVERDMALDYPYSPHIKRRFITARVRELLRKAMAGEE